MPRKATIGPAVYQRVNELVGEGKTRTQAFAAVATERGQTPGTVSANFYRVARTQGATRTRRRGERRASTTPKRTTRAARPATAAPTRATPATARSGDSDLGALAAQIATLTQQLVQQIEARDAKLRELIG